MEIYYVNHKAERLFASNEEIRKKFEKGVASKIIRLIERLQNVQSLHNLAGAIEYRLHELHGKDAGRFSLDVSANLRMLVVPCGKCSMKEEGGFDLKTITSVTIEEVADTHEGKVRRK